MFLRRAYHDNFVHIVNGERVRPVSEEQGRGKKKQPKQAATVKFCVHVGNCYRETIRYGSFWASILVVFLGVDKFESCLACRVAAVVVAKGDAFVLVSFQLNAALQPLQHRLSERVDELFVGIDGIVVEAVHYRIVFGQCAGLDVIADAVHTCAFVHELWAFRLGELLKYTLELLVLRLALTGTEG